MSRTPIIILTAAVLIVLVAGGFLAWFIVSNVNAFRFAGGSPTYQDVKVEIPTDANNQTLAVFNFRSQGDADAKYYAIGFARALADRLYCAPTAVTQQVTMAEIGQQFGAAKMDARTSPRDDIAAKMGRKLAVAWVVTGDMGLSSGRSSLKLRLLNTGSGKAAEYRAEGPLSDLPALQTKLAKQIVDGMGLKPTEGQIAELARPNFSNPQILSLYGRALFENTDEKCEGLRWQALDSDPHSSFAALRLLEYYHHVDLPIPRMQANKKLQMLIGSVDCEFSGNSQVRVMKGLLLVDQCEFADGQTYLQKLVEDDPDMVRAHSALGYVARCREDGDLAVAQCSEAVRLWPNNAYLHAALASAYGLASDNARRGNYLSDMSWSRSNKWRSCCNNQLDEAVTAIKVDKDCSDGWSELMSVSLQLGRIRDRETAYHEMIRINPKNLDAYETYSGCFLPQWGGSTSDLDRICSEAEAAFGKDAPEVFSLRAWALSRYPRDTGLHETILQTLESGLKRCKQPDPDMLHNKSVTLLEINRIDEAQAIALEGVNRWNTLGWRMQLARCYAMRWDKGHRDRAALDKAAELYKEYEHEVPFDTIGYVQYGWCLSHQGHRDGARAQFQKGLELDPGNQVLTAKMKYVE